MSPYSFTCLICEHDFPIEKYGGGTCPKCGQEYEYDEGNHIVLTGTQVALLRELAMLPTVDLSTKRPDGTPLYHAPLGTPRDAVCSECGHTPGTHGVYGKAHAWKP